MSLRPLHKLRQNVREHQHSIFIRKRITRNYVYHIPLKVLTGKKKQQPRRTAASLFYIAGLPGVVVFKFHFNSHAILHGSESHSKCDL